MSHVFLLGFWNLVHVVLVYVDDILVMAKSEKDVDLIFTTIEKHVTLKRTDLSIPAM